MRDDLSDLRTDYADRALRAVDAGSDPMRAFAGWFDDAAARSTVVEPNACSLATCGIDGTPSVRMVLLKGVDPARSAFATYTNLDGRKARELERAGRGALCWWWPGDPARQVRVVGRIEPIDRTAAAAYFATRPAAARVGAAASEQSRAIGSRAELDARTAAIDPDTVQLPPTWGGYWIVADELELWQGRTGRLHDRISFLRVDGDDRVISRAAAESAGGDDQLARCGTLVTDDAGGRWLRVRLAP